MRRIMVDHARERQSLKRGGGALKVTLDEAALVTETRSQELLDLDEALERLAVQDARKSQIVELRYFGGLTVEETAEFLKLSQRTVEREWTMAEGVALPGAERGRNLMNAERWKQVNDLFQSAVERAPEERAAFLDEACHDDEGMRREVESLLTSHERAENFIEVPAFEVAPELVTNDRAGRIGRKIDWSLPDRVTHRRRRNGRGLSRAGRATRAQSRAQASTA